MTRWHYRCAECGNPRHFLRFYVRGAIAHFVLVHLIPVRWLPMWLAGLAGDYAHDHRQCARTCGPELLRDPK